MTNPAGRSRKSLLTRALWIAAAALALLALPAFGQDRVAQLSKVSGSVEITRAADGSKDQARQVGPRVRGGSVYAGDIVATLGGAAATVAFSDGSKVDMAENTSLTVREVDLSAMVLAGQRDKPLGRRIKILAGDVYSEIVENPGLLTEFETPSGVAAVKGTKLFISVGQAGSSVEEAEEPAGQAEDP